MDILEELVYVKQNGIPKEDSERILFLQRIYDNTLFGIYYEDLCKYLSEFNDIYSLNRLRELLRKYKIIGKDLKKEITVANMTEEERLFIKLYFKGKVEDL